MTERADPVRTCPERTCIGCRERAAKSDLLRVVAAGNESGVSLLVPDPRGVRPGRGAHLHPTADCLATAERRKAFGRALRLPNPVDVTAVRDYVFQHDHQSLEGRTTTDERSMSTQHR